MSSNFFAMVERMKLIDRWALMNNTGKENIAEHSHTVAVIAHALALIGNKKFGRSYNAERCALLALYHDTTEVITGDMPTPVKYYNDTIRRAYKEIEATAGDRLLPMLPEVSPEDVAVVELSSFQLISMHASPNIAVVTNVTPNHLDHHKDMQEYINAKRNILLYQKQPCRAVLGYENEISRSMQKDCKGRQVWFTRLHETDRGAFLRESDDTLCYAENGVVTGDGDGTFAPNRPTSTGEMLKLVLLSTGHKEQKPSTAHWASGYATYAYSMGFAAQNYSDYQLDNGISRLDVARFAAKALGYGASNTTSPFADVNDGYVTALYEAGVFIGTKVGDLTYFYPNSSITRAEVATIVYRIYQLSSLDQKQKIYYKDYTLDVLEGVPTNTYNQSAFVKNGSIMTYNDPSVRTRVGIDVSQYQGDVDWNAVARTDVDFVIARVGGRGYTVGAIYDDTKFDEYADGAARAGLQVGAYFFSQAVSVAEAQEEAYHVLDKLRGHEITGPVVFDWEVIGKREARTYGIETGVLCAAANAFCKIIKDAGYDPMIYITDYAGYVKYDLSEVMDYPLWYARYDVDAPSFYYDFAMWQYSSKGSVDGIKGNVDMDIWFIK
mgnify:CR=1 FL=1